MTDPVSPPPKTPEARPSGPIGPRPAMPRPTIPPSPPAKTPASAAARESVPPIAPTRSLALPILYFIGFAILASAIAWMWQNPPLPPEAPAEALQERLQTLEARLARLEARPEAKPAPIPDSSQLIARLAALEARAANPPGTPATQPAANSPNLGPLEARIAAVEARPATPPVDAALTQQIGRIARIQAASAALEAGHKLGELPDAPPALQRFANASPPTEASLRLAFPAAMQTALVASRPIDPDLPVLSRIWGRLQELITIRQGERVLVGDPAAGVLANAKQTLDAGDLAGAVAILDRLNPPAAKAMSDWTASAQALLKARAALAEMSARAAGVAVPG